MIKKVLFISPTPTHPANAGNRQHIKTLVIFFKQQGWETHFLYLALEDYNEDEMRSYFEDRLYIIPRKDLFDNRKTIPYILHKIFSKALRLKRKLQLYLRVITKDQYVYNSEADGIFTLVAKPLIKKLQEKHDFKMVVCEYAFLSQSFTYFDRSVYKILDTHDTFTDRFKIYLNNNLKPSWISLYKKQEIKALTRANIILAVQQSDAAYFSDLAGKKAVVFNAIPEITHLAAKEVGKKLLYLASANDINIATIGFFIKHTLPLVLAKHPETILIIGGSICDKLAVENKNIMLKGRIEDLAAFYAAGDIVINPEISGTGYKVKALEALSYGMPLVATSAGAAGVEKPFTNHLFIAGTPVEFANMINKLFDDNALLVQTSVNAHNWISSFKEKMTNDVLQVIPA